MFLICRSSTRIRSNRRAMPVETFSAQSLRRSVSRAFSRAIACLTRPRRFEPRLARASVRCSRRSRVRSRAVRAGAVQHLAGGQGRGDRHAPVDAHRLAVTRCRHRRGDHGEGDVPAAGAVHRDPVGLRAGGTARDQRNLTHPAFGYPDLADLAGHRRTSHCRPRCPVIRNPSSPPGLAPGRPPGRVGPGRRTPSSPGRSPAGPAAGRSGTWPPARGARLVRAVS